jgi:hypothetical protein
LDDEQREQRARAGGNATLNLYGRDYYSFLGKLRRKTPTAPRKSVADDPPKISVATRRMWGMAAAMVATSPRLPREMTAKLRKERSSDTTALSSQQGKNRGAMNTQ